jgi:hypothetical protein
MFQHSNLVGPMPFFSCSPIKFSFPCKLRWSLLQENELQADSELRELLYGLEGEDQTNLKVILHVHSCRMLLCTAGFWVGSGLCFQCFQDTAVYERDPIQKLLIVTLSLFLRASASQSHDAQRSPPPFAMKMPLPKLLHALPKMRTFLHLGGAFFAFLRFIPDYFSPWRQIMPLEHHLDMLIWAMQFAGCRAQPEWCFGPATSAIRVSRPERKYRIQSHKECSRNRSHCEKNGSCFFEHCAYGGCVSLSFLFPTLRRRFYCSVPVLGCACHVICRQGQRPELSFLTILSLAMILHMPRENTMLDQEL